MISCNFTGDNANELCVPLEYLEIPKQGNKSPSHCCHIFCCIDFFWILIMEKHASIFLNLKY